MIIHHMSDGSIRKNIDGFIVPKKFKKVYILANQIKKENNNGDGSKSKTINKP